MAALRSELRELRPWYWAFQSRYAGPDERRLRGVVTEAGFRVRREPVREIYGQWRNLAGPLPAARGTIVASEGGSVIVLEPEFDTFAVVNYLIALAVVFLIGLVVFPLGFFIFVGLGWWLYGMAAEWRKLTELIGTILEAPAYDA